jgi:hypothetical protein
MFALGFEPTRRNFCRNLRNCPTPQKCHSLWHKSAAAEKVQQPAAQWVLNASAPSVEPPLLPAPEKRKADRRLKPSSKKQPTRGRKK